MSLSRPRLQGLLQCLGQCQEVPELVSQQGQADLPVHTPALPLLCLDPAPGLLLHLGQARGHDGLELHDLHVQQAGRLRRGEPPGQNSHPVYPVVRPEDRLPVRNLSP